MKFFVAFAALVCVATANRPAYQRPSILPALVEDHPAVGPAWVEDHPAVGPALVEHEYETPAFGPALIDFPVNAEGLPVAVAPPVLEASSPLVQIIVNVAKPAVPSYEPHVVVPKPEGVDLSLLQPRL